MWTLRKIASRAKPSGARINPLVLPLANLVSTDFNDWAEVGAAKSIVGDVLRMTNTGAAAGYVYFSFPTEIGHTYTVDLDALGGTSGSSLRVGTSANNTTSLNVTPSGVSTYTFVATATLTFITLRNSTAISGRYTEWRDVLVTY